MLIMHVDNIGRIDCGNFLYFETVMFQVVAIVLEATKVRHHLHGHHGVLNMLVQEDKYLCQMNFKRR